MNNNPELHRLEQFVDKLLNKYNQLKADYLALQEILRERDGECSDLKNNVANLSSERTEVGSRVAGLLDRIEQWENEHADSPQGGHEGAMLGEGSDNQ